MIIISNLRKKYSNTVIRDLNFTIENNTFLHIKGENGSGKTTLLKIIAGIESMSSGTITIDGINLGKNPDEYINNIGYLSDTPFLYPFLTGKEHIQLDMSIRKGRDESQPFTLAEKLGLSISDLREPVKNYSKGMKQKLAFILAIYHNPNVLIMDEPFTGMDKNSLATAITYCKTIMENKIILFSSHQQEIVDALSDSSLTIDKLK